MSKIVCCKICGKPLSVSEFSDGFRECKPDRYSIFPIPKTDATYECIISGGLYFHYKSGEQNAFIKNMKNEILLLTIPMTQLTEQDARYWHDRMKQLQAFL